MQIIRLVGVFEDGSDLKPRVPGNTAKTIQFPLLTDVTIQVEVVNPAGVAVDLSSFTSWTSWFTVVMSPDSCEQAAGQNDYQLQSAVVVAETRNVISFVIPRTALRRFPAGQYFYDVSLETTVGAVITKYQIVRISGLALEAVLRRA